MGRGNELQPLYRRQSVAGARRMMAEAQTHVRIEFTAVLVGLVLEWDVVGIPWRIVAQAEGFLYACTADRIFRGECRTRRAKAYTAHPWRTLGLLSVGWAVLAVDVVAR